MIDPIRAERLEKKYAYMKAGKEKRTLSAGGIAALRSSSLAASGKPKNMKVTVKRLFSYLEHDKFLLAFAIACVLIHTVATLAASYMLRPIINTYIIPGSGNAELAGLGIALAFMAGVYAVGLLAQYIQLRIMAVISQRALKRLRTDLFKKVQSLPVRYFDNTPTGDTMSLFTNDIDSVGELLNSTIIQVIGGAVTLVGTLLLMAYTNIWLTLITLVTIPLLTFLSNAIMKQSRKPYQESQNFLGVLNGFAEETISGEKVVKVFGHEKIAQDEFAYLNQKLKEKQIKAQFRSSTMGPVTHNINNITYGITAAVGGILCVTSGFDIGGLTIFVNYTRQFSRPINELSMQMNTVFSALAGAERVFGVLDSKEEVPDSPECVKADTLIGHVVFSHVDFGYTENRTILKDISLYANPGERIALVGSTGAGKTTITNLLNRFYDINKGKITIDEIPLERYPRAFLRKNIAMVLQDTHLFTGTVRENIRYGRLDATDGEVAEAAKLSCADSFIINLQKGYDTVIENDGANLSQGQRQLLNIARAAISKAPILVLDEATSSVDTRTERNIEKGMDALMENRTTFVIAHRLSTVRTADAIMVLEQGKIIERGTHAELLEKKGEYYQLYTGAFELE